MRSENFVFVTHINLGDVGVGVVVVLWSFLEVVYTIVFCRPDSTPILPKIFS